MRFLKNFAIILGCLCLINCDGNEKDENIIKFAVSADYPPFAYYENAEKMTGFEIELASKISEKLGRKAKFEDMQFSNITLSVSNDRADAGIAAITSTKEREENFDFSKSYYKSEMTLVFLKQNPIRKGEELKNKKIACQLGTTMELWLKSNTSDCIIASMDTAAQLIESLKAGHVDAALLDGAQAAEYIRKNEKLGSFVIAEADDGYKILLPKNAKLKNDINAAIESLEASGEIEELKKKWFR